MLFPTRSSIASLVALALVLVVGAGCSGGGEVCAEGATCRDAGATADGRVRQPLATDLISLALDPTGPVLDASGGTHPTVTFTAVGFQRDGRTRRLTGAAMRFSVDLAAIGTIGASTGLFTAAGLGGVAQVRVATLDGSMLTAATTVTVNVHTTVLGPGVTDADVTRFNAATPSSDASMSPTIDYPLSGAVMPMNVYPPKVMWTPHHAGAGATDLWRVRLVRPHSTLEGYFASPAGFDHSWRSEIPVWRGLSQSDVGAPIQTQVAVLSGTTRYESTNLPFRTVDAVIAGSVYYWSPPQARLIRLDVEPAARVDFLPHPGDTCIGCHSVSRDGRHLAGFLEGSSETLAAYDTTRDLTASPAPNAWRLTYSVRRCTSWNADATRLVSGDCGANPTTTPFSIIDTSTGVTIDALTGMAGDGFDPEWSPDNAGIAFTNRSNDLAVTAVTPGDHFGATTVIHTASSTPDGAIDWHPTWTPDSAWLAFQHGDTRRTGVAMGGGIRGALYLIGRAGGTPVRLDHLGGGLDAYRPIFSPFNSGGYFWILFTATRPYGNAAAGVHGQKQIWVAAIRNHPNGTTDPSEVPYYLSGQEAATALSPYWAPPPCRANGSGCATGSDCCSGQCDPDTTGTPMCVPPSTTCRVRGDSCGGSGDCCAGLTCTPAHICDLPEPG